VPTSEKIEPAPRGDHTRGLGGFGAGFFSAFNRNKRSLAIDLKSQDEQEAMYRLVRTADVVIENFGLPALPIEFGTDRQRPGITRQPPRIGQHNAEVLAEAGFTAAEISALADAKVIIAAS
jgi:crotonobetainyl-CoA:carnitine CoA-transferase CaiB-like acyl-CoA transferase